MNDQESLAKEIERLKGTTAAMKASGDSSRLLSAHQKMLAYLEAKNGDPSARPVMPWEAEDCARHGAI